MVDAVIWICFFFFLMACIFRENNKDQSLEIVGCFLNYNLNGWWLETILNTLLYSQLVIISSQQGWKQFLKTINQLTPTSLVCIRFPFHTP